MTDKMVRIFALLAIFVTVANADGAVPLPSSCDRKCGSECTLSCTLDLTSLDFLAHLKAGPSDWAELSVSLNEIPILRQGAFSNPALSKVNRISLQFNEIKTIETGAFRDASKNLTVLYLNNNELTKIEKQTFAGAEKLQRLSLENNRISTIDAEAFKGLTELKNLDLSNNKITTADNYLKGLSQLFVLDLARNKLSTSLGNPTFAGLANLNILYLEENQIPEIKPEAFFGLSSLTRLNVASNKLRAVSPALFESTPDLIFFNASSNDFGDSIGSSIRATFHTLALANCNIKSLPVDAFKLLPDLEAIDLSHNKITQLKDDLFKPITGLRRLNLEHNLLTTLSQNTIDALFPILDKQKKDVTYNLELSNNPWDCSDLTKAKITGFDKTKGTKFVHLICGSH